MSRYPSRIGFVIALLALSACGEPKASPASAAPAGAEAARAESVDIAGLHAAKAAGEIHLVDVRTPEEYAQGHVPGAVNLPLNELQSRKGELSAYMNEDVYLICKSGRRSASAQVLLKQSGFGRTINVEGGTDAWRAAGHPTE